MKASFSLPAARPTAVASALLALTLLGVSAPSHAQARADALPLWELGAVGLGVSQQAYPGSDQQVQRRLLVPFAVYRGPLLRADRDGIGLRAIRTDRFELDLSAALAFGAGSDALEARTGMPELGTLVELGPRLKWRLDATADSPGRWRVEVPLRGVYDISDSFAGRGLSLEPELRYDVRQSGWAYSLSGGLLLGNQRLASTFYEVTRGQATADRPAYASRGGLIATRLGATASRSLTPQLRALAFVRLDSVAGAANASSPLVRQTNGLSAGVGFIYVFARSSQRAAD